MWTPRRSHDQPEKNPSATDGHATNSTSRKHIGTKSSDSRPSIDSPRRRSSSDSATPRQTPVSNTRFLSSTAAAAQDPNRNVLSPSSATDAFSSSKRLGFFAEKLSGHSPVHSVDQKSLLQPFHPRADSALAQNTLTPNMASSSTMTGSKTHTSPSKVTLCSSMVYNRFHLFLYRHRMGGLMIPNLVSCVVCTCNRNPKF